MTEDKPSRETKLLLRMRAYAEIEAIDAQIEALENSRRIWERYLKRDPELDQKGQEEEGQE